MTRTVPAAAFDLFPAQGGYRPDVREALIGWWVDGQWCPTRAVRDHRVARVTREREDARLTSEIEGCFETVRQYLRAAGHLPEGTSQSAEVREIHSPSHSPHAGTPGRIGPQR